MFRHNKIIEAMQNDEKQSNNDESVDLNLDETNQNNKSVNSMAESGEVKKKLPKSFVKEIFERRNKNRVGSQIVEESLKNMYVNKLMSTHARSNSRG